MEALIRAHSVPLIVHPVRAHRALLNRSVGIKIFLLASPPGTGSPRKGVFLQNVFPPARGLKRMKVRAHVFFEGLVQGVFFRANTVRCAESLGLTGWVRNTGDGRVEAVFEGDKEAVEKAVEWCAAKQPYAQVRSKSVEFSEHRSEFDAFSIVP